MVHKALFPLDRQPRGLSALLSRFCNGEAAQGFIRPQLVSGAQYALALVRRRHPYLVLTGIERVPARPDGEPTSLEAHYQDVEDATVTLVDKLERDTDLQLEHVSLRAPKSELAV